MSKEKKTYTRYLKDPVLEPYYLQLDDYGYVLHKSITAGESGNDYSQVIGYYNNLAQLAYDAANTAFVAGGQIAGAYANAAFVTANAAFAGTTGTHANAAYSTANTALVDAALADQKAVTANTNPNVFGALKEDVK